MRLSLLAALLLTIVACAGSQQVPRPDLHPDVGEVPADMKSDYESFAVNCSKCHDLERALAAPVTDTRHWDMYVAKMMRTAGSAINPSEAPHILRFLYWYTETKNKAATGGSAKKASEYEYSAPPPLSGAPPNVVPPTKEDSQAPVPAPSVPSGTEGVTP
jgi:hypothetical protein